MGVVRDHLAAVLAAGVMFAAFLVEALASGVLLRDGRHERRDTVANLLIGAGYVASSALEGIVVTAVLAAVWSRSPLRWDMRSGWSWIALLLGEDFLYYWSHRASHRVPVMWASHAVHHNSPRLNLSTGMRNSWVGGWLDWVFFLPLAALGFHPLHLGVVQALATAWDFLAHTPYFPKNRVLDLLFNSPSNHQVHHGANPEYVDKNLGGFLIVWDRLFGTYQREEAPAIYGIDPMPARPYDPLHVEFYLWAAWLGRLRGGR
jgi:sterol desaturase/sphingolipid hydroxylase (fatty acid hydroxylase superfamily)